MEESTRDCGCIVAARVVDAKQEGLAKITPCHKCGEDCWVSAMTVAECVAELKKSGLPPKWVAICSECAREHINFELENIQPPSAARTAEINSQLGTNFTPQELVVLLKRAMQQQQQDKKAKAASQWPIPGATAAPVGRNRIRPYLDKPPLP